MTINKFTQEFAWCRAKARAYNKTLPSFLIEYAYRRATASSRSIANCIIIGAQKAGSSSLHYYLSQHPQVKQAFGKEIHYFDGSITNNHDTFNKGENWYRAHFPLKAQMNANDICIDATPMYLFNPLVAKRMHAQIPDSKIIVLLRNPVERAISHYFHSKKMGWETLPIEQALAQEASRLSYAQDNQDFKETNFRVFSYQARGLYWQQIERFLQYYPREQIHFVQSEKLFQQPHKVLAEIYNFLDISDHHTADVNAKNIGNKNQQIPEHIYQALQNYFYQPNQALFKGIGQTFDW